MTEIKCPSCGQSITVLEKKSGLPWLIGCLVALIAIPIVLAVIGLLAAIAIPSFMRARETSQVNACVNNMRQIEAAKDQWALENGVPIGGAVDVAGVNKLIKGNATPVCPKQGTYKYREVGVDPECSVHGTLSDPIRTPHASSNDSD